MGGLGADISKISKPCLKPLGNAEVILVACRAHPVNLILYSTGRDWRVFLLLEWPTQWGGCFFHFFQLTRLKAGKPHQNCWKMMLYNVKFPWITWNHHLKYLTPLKSSIVRIMTSCFVGKMMGSHWPRPPVRSPCREFVENHCPMETMKETRRKWENLKWWRRGCLKQETEYTCLKSCKDMSAFSWFHFLFPHLPGEGC